MQKRVFTWGFGGYGRLGHNEPKDEPVPRSIKLFDIPNRGAAKIWAGATYSMALSEIGRERKNCCAPDFFEILKTVFTVQKNSYPFFSSSKLKFILNMS